MSITEEQKQLLVRRSFMLAHEELLKTGETRVTHRVFFEGCDIPFAVANPEKQSFPIAVIRAMQQLETKPVAVITTSEAWFTSRRAKTEEERKAFESVRPSEEPDRMEVLISVGAFGSSVIQAGRGIIRDSGGKPKLSEMELPELAGAPQDAVQATQGMLTTLMDPLVDENGQLLIENAPPGLNEHLVETAAALVKDFFSQIEAIKKNAKVASPTIN